jgi:Rieske 2Fe-2S family protein
MQDEGEDFRRSDYPLYPVAVCEWGGFAFIKLSARPGEALDASLAIEAARLTNWPLETLALVHREVHEVACNWKIFWENYSECYHCPGTHPALCRLVPLYGEGLTNPGFLPDDHPLAATPAGLRPGAVTWSTDGTTPLPWFENLDESQRESGMTFVDFLPSMFVIAHVDHVRSVRVWPLTAERTRLTVEWLLQPDVLAGGQVDIERLVSFARQVVGEDARACEINQGGLRSRAHRHSVLLPFEEDVAAFDNWVRRQLPASG